MGEFEEYECVRPADSTTEEGEQVTSTTQSKIHYLVSEYASQGDLHGFITNAPNQRLDESQARHLLRQVLLAVRYAHARSVVHLDISCENVCITANGDACLIDWGLATIHPQCASVLPVGGETAQSVDTACRLVAMTAPVPPVSRTLSDGKVVYSCDCKPCTSTLYDLENRAAHQVSQSLQSFPTYASAVTSINDGVSWFVRTAPALRKSFFSAITHESNANQNKVISSAVSSASLYSRCKMLMRPVCVQSMVPGKPYTTPPELMDQIADAAPWDAYAADTFALGVLLYVMLAGKPPFKLAHASVCKWYAWISSSKWRSTHGGTNTEVYEHLSQEARDFIDVCIKSQYLRPTVDQLLSHVWMNPSSERSTVRSM